MVVRANLRFRFAAAVLTRLEVSGFKNLVGLEVDFGPFTCIAGPNGTGKSNVFDAIQFLSLLAQHPIMEAAQLVRSTTGRSSDPKDLLFAQGEHQSSEMSLAAEMIVPQIVTDDFGREAIVTSTFLRYEVRLAYESASSGFGSLGRLVLLHESLDYIRKTDAPKHIPWASPAFRDAVIVNGRKSQSGFISTDENDDGVRTINVHQDAGSRGQPRPSPAKTAPRTIVCTTNTASDPTVLAARREMQAWRAIALEPTAMRSPDDFSAPSQIASNGAHMAATLYRLAVLTPPAEQEVAGESYTEEVYASVARRLSKLIDARDVRVDRDDKRELLTLELRHGTGGFFPARSLSDGTLRFLALSLLDADPSVEGVITMEEPENGIHPERLPAMVELLRGIAVDPSDAPSPDNPLRQVIVNTHSPGFVQLQDKEDLLLAKTALVSDGDYPARVLRLRPLAGSWRSKRSSGSVGKGGIIAYLSRPPGAQLDLGAWQATSAHDAD